MEKLELKNELEVKKSEQLIYSKYKLGVGSNVKPERDIVCIVPRVGKLGCLDCFSHNNLNIKDNFYFDIL